MRRILLVLLITLLFCSMWTRESNATTDDSIQVAFVRQGNLWLKEGKSEKQLTQFGNVLNPKWSHDGRMIAYNKEKEIWIYDLRENKNIRVFQSPQEDMVRHNLQWAPHQEVLAFQSGRGLEVKDVRFGESNSRGLRLVSEGVDQYSWMPDGKAFLVSSTATLLPDGWTNPILFRMPWESEFPNTHATRFFTIPKEIRIGDTKIWSIGTSPFKWSADGKWIAFVIHPTASWSMDSDVLCVLSRDGQTFIPQDEMLLNTNWFKWAPQSNRLGYIAGGGRFVFATPKRLKIQEFPALKLLLFTPAHFKETAFTWHNNNVITVARTPEYKWSNNPSERPLPCLYQINLAQKSQKQITYPPASYGDTGPHFLQKAHKLTWVRYDRTKADVWIANADGSEAKLWIRGLMTSGLKIERDDWESVLSWYDEK